MKKWIEESRTYDPNTGELIATMTVEKTERLVSYEILKGGDELPVLPESFIKMIQEKKGEQK
jgi:hypothetical protein